MNTDKQDLLIKVLAKKYNIDPRVCKAVVDSPFLYLKYLVTSSSEEDGLRIPYFGAFCQKGEYKNKIMRTENRVKNLLLDIEQVAVMMHSMLGFELQSVDSAKRIIETAFEVGDYDKINMIWEGWQEFSDKK